MNTSKEIMVDVGGKIYSIESDDDYLENIKNGFEPHMVKLFKSLVVTSEVTLDIGANIGCTALLFGDLSKKVFAFEPSSTTFKFLKKNILKSGLENIHLYNIALGADSYESTLTFAPTNRAGGFVSDQTQASVGHTTEKIIIQRLDEIVETLKLDRIDFIKIDVEGFEAHVLRGGKRTIPLYKPIVVLELNHWCLNAFQRTSIPDFFDFLRSTFPILLAIDGSNYLDLHNQSDAYIVMYHHIIHMRFPNILASFEENSLSAFKKSHQYGFVA